MPLVLAMVRYLFIPTNLFKSGATGIPTMKRFLAVIPDILRFRLARETSHCQRIPWKTAVPAEGE